MSEENKEEFSVITDAEMDAQNPCLQLQSQGVESWGLHQRIRP